MKKIIALVVVIILLGGAAAYFVLEGTKEEGDIHIYSVNNIDGKITPKVIEEAFKDSGFSIGIRSEMNGPFKKQFNETKFKVFTLLTVYHKKISQEMVKEHADSGVFVPMGVGIYQEINENEIHISVLTAKTQAKILGVNVSGLVELENEVSQVITELMPDAKEDYSSKNFPETRKLVTRYELDLDGESWEDAKEELELNLESEFEPFGFVMPGFLDFNIEMTDDGRIESPFDFYDAYSVCKLAVIYTTAQTRPEASAFAPCTAIVYKKKDEDSIVVAFPSVYNWMSSARVEDEDARAVLTKAQADFESVVKDITE